jgi:hypothetical protein
VLRFDPEQDDAGQTLVQSPGAEGIATDGTFLFWVGDSSGEVWRANMDGTSTFLLADQQPDPIGIAADADGPFAYWTTFAPVPDGGVYRVVK